MCTCWPSIPCYIQGLDVRLILLPFVMFLLNEIHSFCYRGGARGAPTICRDDDWSSLKGQLAATKAAIDSIQVIVSMKELEPYKSHKRVCIHQSSVCSI